MVEASYVIAPRASRSGLPLLPFTDFSKAASPLGHSFGMPSSLIVFGGTRSARRGLLWALAGEVAEVAASAASSEGRTTVWDRARGWVKVRRDAWRCMGWLFGRGEAWVCSAKIPPSGGL